jgi:hypothetical protein
MKNINLTSSLYSTTALTIATSLASAFALTASVRASALDPADPYQYTAGQYPTAQQSYGLPPQYSGQESMGMRQQRMASGNVQQERIYETSSGSQVSLTTQSTNNLQNAAVANNVAMDEQNLSPVMRAIRQSLRTIASVRGAAAVTDANDISPVLADAPYETHDMLAVYQQRITASSRSIESLQARSAQFAGDTQANFNSSMQDVSTARAQLDQDFAAAQTATPENWNQVRSSLGVDYKRYSDAVTRAEQIGNGHSSS